MIRKFNIALVMAFLGVMTAFGQTKDEVIAKFNEGAADVNNGNFSLAIQHFSEVLTMAEAPGADAADLVAKVKTQLPVLYYQVALGLIKQKKYEDALPNLEKTIELANLYGNNADIKEKASKYIPQLAVGVGTLKYRDGNTEAAMKMFDLTLSYEPNNGKAYLGKGLIYNDQEEIKKMIENLEKAIELSATTDAKTADLARQTIAKYYVKTGDSELEALDPAEEDFSYIIEQYEQALGYDPSNADAHYKLAVINNRMVEYDKALLHCKKALETETNDIKIAAINFELGNAYVGNAEYALACESFSKAMVGIFEEKALAKKKNVPGCN